ncbi:MAG: hypothetical protein OEY67_02040 [Gammaproteobacteria bacterium]|nr:hypothetical protein [Gammaproteobacteria bacterium]
MMARNNYFDTAKIMSMTSMTHSSLSGTADMFNRILSIRVSLFLSLLVAVFLAFSPGIGQAAGKPIIFYTDILSGPNIGGENDNGAYLSIFGKNFGNSLSDVKVFINGSEVADYKYLGASKGRPDIQQLSVQVGPVSSGPITVEVAGVASNSNRTFTVQPGNIYYVSLSGSDSNGVVNDITRPFRTVQDSSNNGVWPDRVGPGDMIVMRGGEWFDIGMYNRFLRTQGVSGSAPTGSTGSGPITLMGYPGENIIIHCGSSGGIHQGGDSKWLVFANLGIVGGDSTQTDGPINLQARSDYWRVVNNKLYDWDAGTEARAGGIAGNGNHIRLIGNHIDNIGGGTKNHGIYVDFDGSPVSVNDIEIAWNHIENSTGGNLLQLYGASGSITNVDIHHNLLHDGNRYGINLSDGSDLNIRVWNNIVYNTAYAGFRVNANNPQGMYAFNNVFYNVDTASYSGAVANDWSMSSAVMEFKNNIVVPASNSSRGYMNGSWGTAVFQRNLWFGDGAPPSADSSPVGGSEQDPRFVNPSFGNFNLSSTSPAIDSGLNLSSVVATDYFGNNRPIDGDNNGVAAMDVGAVEYGTSAVVLQKPATPSLTLIIQ